MVHSPTHLFCDANANAETGSSRSHAGRSISDPPGFVKLRPSQPEGRSRWDAVGPWRIWQWLCL